VLRTSLRPGLLRAVAYNASHRNEEVGLFELGKVFLPPLSGQERPPEPEHLGVIRAGREAPDAVAVWNALADRLALPGPGLRAAALPGLHPTRGAVVTAGDRDVGAVGEIDPAVAEAWGITGRVAWLELDLDVVDALVRRERRYRTVSRYPSNDIDLAFVVDDQVPAAAVEATVAGAAGDLLASLRLFDVFRGGSLPDGTRSLAYALRLQATDRTLTDAEVAQVRQAVIDAASSAHGALLRG
jgi:phenylalanyl-tRNA synthetase beta chain